MLDSGEKAEIQVWLMNRTTATAITSNSSVNYMASGGLTSSGILLTHGCEPMGVVAEGVVAVGVGTSEVCACCGRERPTLWLS